MTFFEQLSSATDRHRAELLASPVIVDCMSGHVSLDTYIAFLTEAYHHVRHTVPLLMACGSRLPDRYASLRDDIVAYIDEEHGHEQWILDDLAACGADRDAVVARGPGFATELMVSFVYDQIARVNPLSFFGMVYVLEGTSVTIATPAANIIGVQLGLPRSALRYLLSHGSVDQKHIGDFERIVNRIDRAEDRAAIVHTAQVVFRLYGEMFHSLPRWNEADAETGAREVA